MKKINVIQDKVIIGMKELNNNFYFIYSGEVNVASKQMVTSNSISTTDVNTLETTQFVVLTQGG